MKDDKLTLKRVFGIDKLELHGPYQRDIAGAFRGHPTLEKPYIEFMISSL